MSVCYMRLECLKLAAQNAGNPDEILRLAERYFDWLITLDDLPPDGLERDADEVLLAA